MGAFARRAGGGWGGLQRTSDRPCQLEGSEFQIGVTGLSRGIASLAGSILSAGSHQGLLSLCGLCPGALAQPQRSLGSV